jgi:hypothetical protein
LDRETVNVADLKLDGQNPRHEPEKSQRDIIDALMAKDGAKIVKLAEDISTLGISPIDTFLVIRESGTSYIVIEGNRRIAAIKLLANPTLTSIPRYQKRIHAIKRKATADPVHEVEAAVATTRAEAKPWQQRRHMGEAGGIGVVRWDAEASTRFFGKHGTQADLALKVIEALRTGYVGKTSLINGLEEIRKTRLTTLGRFVGDPYVRGKLGLQVRPVVAAHYTSEELEPALTKVIEDLATGKVTVTGFKGKEQRRKYVLDLPLPDERNADPDARPLVPAGARKPPKPRLKPKPPKPAPPTAPRPLFDGLALTNLGGRIAGVLTELQSMDVDRYPNAAGALLRVVVELSVTEVHERKGWPVGKLRDMVKKCLSDLDKTGKDPRYQAVRAGLADGTSVLAVATIHAYLHNPNYNPVPSELRGTSANYGPFLAGLDTLV